MSETGKPDYGHDAPYALCAFAGLGALASGGAVAALVSRPAAVAVWLALYGAFFLANAFVFLHTTRRGKFRVWQGILDDLNLHGGERVLDMGCGRGAVLVTVARRLTTGRATGVDVWSTHDQSGNAPDVTLANARVEGVQDRLDISTADMRTLPFGARYNPVLSSGDIRLVPSLAMPPQTRRCDACESSCSGPPDATP